MEDKKSPSLTEYLADDSIFKEFLKDKGLKPDNERQVSPENCLAIGMMSGFIFSAILLFNILPPNSDADPSNPWGNLRSKFENRTGQKSTDLHANPLRLSESAETEGLRLDF